MASHDVDANKSDMAAVSWASRECLSDSKLRRPAKELNLTVSQRLVGIVVIAVFAMSVSTLGRNAAAQVQFTSKQRAFTQGYSAFKSGRYDIAVPALKFAAARDVLRAKFYLAKIYSDNSGGFTDHARAYSILRDIVSTHAHADPKDFRVARFVSKALISIARYERDGIPALRLRPNTKRALQFFDHAASHFNDRDAQFELAKHYLAGDGVEARVPYALNWLARLSKRGHAGAQAFLADLYWDGRYMMKPDRVRALALITVAVENVQEEDRFWIEDLHQNIFCESSLATRQKVHRMVGGWRQRFGGTPRVRKRKTGLAVLGEGTKRFCANGDTVGELIARPAPAKGRDLNGFSTATAASRSAQPIAPDSKPGSMMTTRMNPERGVDRRSLNGFSLQSAGSSQSTGAVSVERSSRKSDESRDLRPLNGFTLQGSTNFGFSVAPRR